MNETKTPRELLAIWRDLLANYARMERLTLDLLTHPESTPDQMADAASRLRNMRTNVRDNYAILRERLPFGYRVMLAVPEFMKKGG
jgi:hypothetical protein